MTRIYIRAEINGRLVHECFKSVDEVKHEINELNDTYSKYGEKYKLYISALAPLGERRIEEEYAEFCIICDRGGLKPLVFFDWLIQYSA